jgi:hypothetical protein
VRTIRNTQIHCVGRMKSYVIYKNSVRTSQETHNVSATETNRLMLFRETVAVYCENHTEHTNTLCGQIATQLAVCFCLLPCLRGIFFVAEKTLPQNINLPPNYTTLNPRTYSATDHTSIPGRGNGPQSSLRRPDLLCGPPSNLSNG